MSDLNLAEAFKLGTDAQKNGDLNLADRYYTAILKSLPDHPSTNNNMGMLAISLGRHEEALSFFARAIESNSSDEQHWINYAVALVHHKKWNEAERLIEKAEERAFSKALIKRLQTIAFNKDTITTHNPPREIIDPIMYLYNARQFEAAIEKATNVIEKYPKAFLVYNILGVVLKNQGKLNEAVASYQKALSLKPDYADTHNNMGNALKDQGKLDEAIASYQKALTLKPDYADAYNNIGNALQNQGKLDEAVASYQKALTLKPDHADAYNNMGNALKDQGKLDEAVASYQKALSLKPDYANAHNNMGNALKDQGKLDDAIASYQKALSLNPDHADAFAEKINQEAQICNWTEVAREETPLKSWGIIGKSAPPFAFLSFEDAPERHRLRSENFAYDKFSQIRRWTSDRPFDIPERLRIAYFSADFHNFPGMYLMAGMLEQHDRTKFEVYAFSYGPKKNDEMRKRIVTAVDHFVDIQSMPRDMVCKLVREKDIHIAIHRNGYTRNERTDLFASGLAPVQVNYLGYPGTLGADFIDYLVADPVIIPEDKRQYYSEQIIYLPYSYQPNDNTRSMSKKVLKRKDMGLPNKGFVFCCFNKGSKISPSEFNIWMRLLDKVDGSILWLLKSNKWAEQNLKQEAEKRGISGTRLIFAERLPHAEHLTRHKLADLFLDTFNYNAHTTASDALWAGLPLVTKLGESFAARVAGSLLNAIGLPELITESENSYEALILDLATNPRKLFKIKKKLSENRLTMPLFNTEKYTRHLENGYQQAYQRYFDGLKPDTIIVSEKDNPATM